MTTPSYTRSTRSARPFGDGIRDIDLRLVVASTDVRYRQKVRAVIVRRHERDEPSDDVFAVELVVLNDSDNIEELAQEANLLDPSRHIRGLAFTEMVDVTLTSSVTGERVMITSMGSQDFDRVERVATLEQIHIGGEDDRGSWVCRIIDAERLDALFGGRVIDVRSETSETAVATS